MSTTREDRLCKVFDYLVFRGKVKTRQEFAEAVGINKTNLSSAMNGNEKYLSDSLFIKVNSVYNNINLQWLLTGEGEMLNPQAAIMTSAEDIEPIPDQQEAMARAMEQGHHVIADAQSIDLTEVPAAIVEEIKAEVVAEAAIPVISPEAANKPNFDVRLYVSEKSGELEHINPTELLKGADAAERVLRGAMQPTFIPSDVIFVRFLQNKTKITDGNIYYFDLKSRPTMIRKVKIEGDKLRLIAENPDFGDVITDFADILNVADIVGMFRTTFSTQYSDIEAVRRRKDEQIDNLIEQNGKALHIITDLINK